MPRDASIATVLGGEEERNPGKL